MALVLRYRSMPGLLVAMTVCAVAVGASRTAEASCGDYLAGNHSVPGDAGRADEPADASRDSDLPNHPAPRPCDGPQCQSGPAAPASMTVAQVPPRDHQQLGLAADGPWSPRAFAIGRVVHNSWFLPAGAPLRVERPPRARA